MSSAFRDVISVIGTGLAVIAFNQKSSQEFKQDLKQVEQEFKQDLKLVEQGLKQDLKALTKAVQELSSSAAKNTPMSAITWVLQETTLLDSFAPVAVGITHEAAHQAIIDSAPEPSRKNSPISSLSNFEKFKTWHAIYKISTNFFFFFS